MTQPKRPKPRTSSKKGRGKKASLATMGRADLEAMLGGMLTGRARFASRAGLQFGGERDLYKSAGYITSGEEQFEDYWALYRRNEIAARIIDLPSKTTWKVPPEISVGGKDGGAFSDAVEALAERIKLWRYFAKADRLAGVGQYAVVVLGTRGTDARGLSTPLTRLSKPEELIYMQAYHEGNAVIDKWVTDTGNPRYGQPELYKVMLSAADKGFAAQTARVHASRILHVCEDPLEDDVYGRPRLQRALNRIFDLDKIAASVGESFWQAATRILQANIDKDAVIDTDGLDQLDDRLTEMVHDLRRQFTGQGAKLEWLPVDVPQPKGVGDFYFALIAAGAEIPRRILFGSEIGELASTADQETYYGMIGERQEQFAEPMLVRQFLDKMIKLGALPQPGKDGYEVIWPTLFEASETEQADANLKRAQIAQALTPVGGDPIALVEIDEDRNVWLIPRKPAPPDLQEAGPHMPAQPDPEAEGGSGAPGPGADGGGTGPSGPSGATGGTGAAEEAGPTGPTGGTAENFDPSKHPKDRQGRWAETDDADGTEARRARALATHKPATAAKQRLGEKQQAKVAKAIEGLETNNNSPMDVIVKMPGGKLLGVEVKCMVDQKNSKITMHPDSLRRKQGWARKERARLATVVVDHRGSSPEFYVRGGVGSWELHTFTKTSLSGLRKTLIAEAM